jgi:hypothetical protein
MRLNKTQQNLLRRAAANADGVTSVQSGFVTSRKKSQYGVRAQDAAIGLAAAGLLTHVTTHISVQQLCHRLGSDHGHDTVWRITDAGREALK